jgi:hypothetical protein
MDNKSVIATFAGLGLIALLIGSVGLVLEVGIGDSYDVMFDTDNASATANATFNAGDATAGITTIHSVTMFTVWAVILGPIGVGAFTIKKGEPETTQRILKLLPVICAFVAFVAFGSIVSEMLGRDYDWSTHTAGENWLALVATGGTIAGVAQLLGVKAK